MQSDSYSNPVQTTADDRTEQAAAEASTTREAPGVQPPAGLKPATTHKTVEIDTTKDAITAIGNATQPSAVNASVTQARAQKYNIISIVQPDGSIKKFQRPVVEGGVTATKQHPRLGSASAGATGATKVGAGKYKIVLIPQPDGSLKKFLRPIVESHDNSVQPPKVGSATSPAEAAKGLAENQAITESNEKEDTKLEAKPTDAAADVQQEKSAGIGAASREHALQEQKQKMRGRKMQGFKGKLTRGFAMAIGSAIPGFEISTHHEAGDQEVFDDDWSDDEDWDDDYCNEPNDLDHNHDHGHDRIENDGHDIEGYHNHEDSHETVALNGRAAIGNLAGAMAVRGAQPSRRQTGPAVSQEKANGGNTNEKREMTYKLTSQDLEDLDQKAAKLKPLKKHWANLTFYILASLSIVLPLLFLMLAIAVLLMDGKELDSSWGVLPQAIKVGVSAWPIIFAAVVAQVFKTFATYKVERGIKLMELEQLVGSNSFASAIKQPIILRRLDVISLVLFVTWCVSPLGSSALQRTYSTEYSVVNKTTTVHYLNTTGTNRLFNRYITGTGRDGSNIKSWFDMVQDISVLYIANFAPSGVSTTAYVDNYDHPRPPWLNNNISSTEIPATTSDYGVPMVLTESIFDSQGHGNPVDDLSVGYLRSEVTNFVMRSGYFNFTCGSWSVVNISLFHLPPPTVVFNRTTMFPIPCSDAAISDNNVYPDNSNYTDGNWYCTERAKGPTTTEWALSSTNSSYSRFGYTDPTVLPELYTVNSIEFASLIKGGSSTESYNGLPVVTNNSVYALMQCSFEQIFIDFGVGCSRSSAGSTAVPECSYDPVFRPVYRASNDPLLNPGAILGAVMARGFSEYMNPNTVSENTFSSTPNEVFLGLYGREQNFDTNAFNLSSLVTPTVFANRLAYLFNTFVNLANYYDFDNGKSFITNFTLERVQEGIEQDFITVRDAYWSYTGPMVFVLDVLWAVLFLVCVAVLLIAGIISVVVESLTVAPDTLGYVSTVARNSRHLQLPKSQVSSAMSGGERANALGSTMVMMQDVKPGADVGRIALGLKHEKAQKLQPGRLYR